MRGATKGIGWRGPACWVRMHGPGPLLERPGQEPSLKRRCRIAWGLSLGVALAVPLPAEPSDGPSPALPGAVAAPAWPDPDPPPAPDNEGVPARAFEPVPGDGRTMGRFAANLGRNLGGILSGPNLKPLVGASCFLDRRSEELLAHRVESFGQIGQEVGGASAMIPFTAALFAVGRAAGGPRFRAATYDGAQAFIVNAVYTTALKEAVGRRRPEGSNRLSFPSGHTSSAFAWATVAGHYYGPKVGVPAYAAAGLIGLSRMEKNQHHFSDVLAGAALGFVVGRTVVRKDGEPLREPGRLRLAPAFAPSGGGAGLSFSLAF
jgi:PAP2 superfamily protein